ncbi:MAG TPA: hypothetical protein ENK23_06575, partial [Sorangium sp.]|nr:hypothetical protein [Sorangium sp.]
MTESDEDAQLLGHIAVAQKLVTPAQLNEALRERARTGGKLGAIMLGRKMIDQRQLGMMLALRKRYHATPQRRASAPAMVRPAAAPSSPGERGAGTRRASPPKTAASRGLQLSDRAAFEARVRSKRAARPSEAAATRAPNPVIRPAAKRPSSTQHRSRRAATPAPRRAAAPAATPARRAGRSREKSSPRARRTPPPGVSVGVSSRTAVAARTAAGRGDGRSGGRVAAVTPAASAAAVVASPGVATPSRRTASAARPRVATPAAAVPAAPAPLAMPTPARQPPPPAQRWSVAPPPAASLPKLEPLPWTPPAANSHAARLNGLLSKAVHAHASDVHIHAGIAPKMRLYGTIVSLDDSRLGAEQTSLSLRAILTPWQLQRLDERGEVDLAYAIDGVGRFRANIYQHHAGCNGVFHVVPANIPSLQSLGLPASLSKLTDYSQGLILATGPTGCGKTSTLAALVDIINKARHDHILTIEDPIEYLHTSQRCIVNQRQVGRHTESFARGLRGALREDPDIICIGELRDLETVSLAMSAAETGHLVLATLHTGSAIGTIN